MTQYIPYSHNSQGFGIEGHAAFLSSTVGPTLGRLEPQGMCKRLDEGSRNACLRNHLERVPSGKIQAYPKGPDTSLPGDSKVGQDLFPVRGLHIILPQQALHRSLQVPYLRMAFGSLFINEVSGPFGIVSPWRWKGWCPRSVICDIACCPILFSSAALRGNRSPGIPPLTCVRPPKFLYRQSPLHHKALLGVVPAQSDTPRKNGCKQPSSLFVTLAVVGRSYTKWAAIGSRPHGM